MLSTECRVASLTSSPVCQSHHRYLLETAGTAPGRFEELHLNERDSGNTRSLARGAQIGPLSTPSPPYMWNFEYSSVQLLRRVKSTSRYMDQII